MKKKGYVCENEGKAEYMINSPKGFIFSRLFLLTLQLDHLNIRIDKINKASTMPFIFILTNILYIKGTKAHIEDTASQFFISAMLAVDQ